MNCPNCNTTNEQGVQRCRVCGTRLIYDDNRIVETTESSKNRGTAKKIETPKNTLPQVRSFDVNGVSFNMIHIEGGTFMMGPPSEQVYGGKIQQVTLDDFYIGEIPVTMELWNAVMGEGAWKWHPYSSLYRIGYRDNVSPIVAVSGVDWEECKEFIDEICLLANTPFRFPTEAEWEYAAKGGKFSRNCKYSGTNSLHKVGGELHDPVKLGIPNELGIFDMSSGCQEWCYDWWHSRDVNMNKPTINPKWEFDSNYYHSDTDRWRHTHMVRGGRVPVWSVGYCYSKSYGNRSCYVGLRLAI